MQMWNKKEHIEQRSTIAGILICSVICGVSLFIFSYRFVSAEITPKWLGLMICVGLAGIILGAQNCKISLHAKSLVVLFCCFLFVFIRKWTTSDFDAPLLMYSGGLFLLFFIIWQIVKVCQPQYLSGTVIFFSFVLSIQGVLQYFGSLSSGKNNFVVTGNFDNPAGFAAALACSLPLCFLFFKHKKKYVRYAAMGVAAMMAIAVFMSGSRAGIMAIAVSLTVWLLAKSIFNCSKHSRCINKRIKNLLAIALISALPFVLYFIKKDSADGRLLIWQCSLNMAADKPVFGHGHGSFRAKYMLYQSEYMNAHPDTHFASLADNVLHPFNEYLLLLTEYGLAGFGMVVLLAILLFRAYQRKPNEENLSALMSLLALAVFAFFSYPFRYPFTWILLFLNVAVIYTSSGINNFSFDSFAPKRLLLPQSYLQRTIIFLLSARLLAYSVILTRAEITWKRIARFSLGNVLPEYDKLYRWLGKDGLFLYNHAAELYKAKEYEKSIAVFEQCTRYHNDMDVQMFLAANYKALGKFIEAAQHYKMAADMCPARFMPLYELAKLYSDANRTEEALALTKKIIDKDVKIPSSTIDVIKREMRMLIEVQESAVEPASADHTSKPSGNKDTRQGETPKVQPNGAALPP